MRKREGKTAAEAMAEFERDPLFTAQRHRLEKELREGVESDARTEAPVLEALRSAGVSVSSIWDLVGAAKVDSRSLPVLLEHLQRAYPSALREGLARALAVPEARFAWPTLATMFGEEQDRRVKDGLAVALAAIADDTRYQELMTMVRDARHGESRVLLLLVLEGSVRPEVRELLLELEGDPQLRKQVRRMLRKNVRRR